MEEPDVVEIHVLAQQELKKYLGRPHKKMAEVDVVQLAEPVIDLMKMEKFHADIYPIFSQASDVWALEIFVSADYFIPPDVPYENVI